MKPEYKKGPDGWQFSLRGEDILFSSKEIAILYRLNDHENITIQKHGPKKTMEEEFERLKQSYQQQGNQKEETSLKLVDVTHANEEKLNEIIQSISIPETRIVELNEPESARIPQQVPLTRDLPETHQHLILKKGKVILDDVLGQKYKTFDLELILKEANCEKLDPEDYSHELVVWPNGTEISKEDYDNNPADYDWMSDDKEIVTDMTEDIRAFLQKEINQAIGKKKNTVKLVECHHLPNSQPQAQDSKALSMLPIVELEPGTTIPTKDEVHELGDKEATRGNERLHRDAKRELAKEAVRTNQQLDWEYHHIPTYREIAKSKILASPESAEKSNTRLKILGLEIELANHKQRGETTKGLNTQIEQASKKLGIHPSDPEPNKTKAEELTIDQM